MTANLEDLSAIEDPLQFVADVKPAIDEELKRILREVPTWRSAPHIPEIMHYAMFAGGGGKRIRPALSLIVAKCLMVPLGEVIGAAAAVELIHTYTLIIDDIQDADDLRRNEPATHVKYGINLSLLAASALLLEGTSRLQDALSNLSPAVLRKILQKLHAGQEADLCSDGWSAQERTVESMEFIFEGKTGALFELSCLVGLGRRNFNSQMTNQVGAIGSEMGIIFQAADDLLEIAGNTRETGKSTGKDRGNKLTFVSVYADEAEARNSISCRRERLEFKIQATFPGSGGDALKTVIAALIDRSR